MSHLTGPKSLAERFEWMSANLPGFREEQDAIRAVELRANLIQCVSEFHKFSHTLNLNPTVASRRALVPEVAGLVAASYLDDLGGLLSSW